MGVCEQEPFRREVTSDGHKTAGIGQRWMRKDEFVCEAVNRHIE
jgi:hypothetical protein